MSRSLVLIPDVTVDPTLFTKSAFYDPLKDVTDLLALGVIQRNTYAGGGQGLPLSAEATGSVDLIPWIPIGIDNRNTSQISSFLTTNGGTLKVQFRFLVRVSDASINVTPRIFNITSNGAATISGAAACSATSDAYSGTNQQQTIALTLPSNVLNYFKPQITIAGSVAEGLKVWATAVFDLFVET